MSTSQIFASPLQVALEDTDDYEEKENDIPDAVEFDGVFETLN
jgi:hypothetical protein